MADTVQWTTALRHRWQLLLRHKWKFFIVSTLIKVIVVISVAITTGNISHFRSKRSVEAEAKTDIKFDDYFSGKFSSRSFYPNWISDTEYVYMDSDHSIKIKDLSAEADADTEVLSGSAWDGTPNPYSWSLSPDRSYVMITSDYTDGYAHYVRTYKWKFFDTSTNAEVSMPTGFPTEGIQKFKWSSSGHELAFVYAFDLYILKDFTSDAIQLTTDGSEGKTFNGIADWLYVGEITDDDALFWWSPNGDYLAFAKVTEDNVHQFEFSVFDAQYPTMVKLPYPKPGTVIPQVSMFMVGTATDISQQLEVQSCISGLGEDFYLNTAAWRNSDTFVAMYKNRHENEAANRHYSIADFFSCQSKTWFDDVASSTGWLGHYKPHDVIPLTDDTYALVNSHQGFPHIQVVDWEGNSSDWRTSGNFEVTDTGSGYHSVFYYDVVNNWIYFTSTEDEENPGEGLPSIRHLWRVAGSGADQSRECVTCRLNVDYKDRCKWVTPSFSNDGTYLIVNCGGTIKGVPITIRMKKNADGNYTVDEVVEDNAQLETTLSGFNVRETTIGTIKLPDDEDNDDYYYIMFTPPNLDPTKKYPLLVEVYSGPGYQRAYDRYSFGWKDFVASSLDVVVLSFDGRGTGYRGDKIMHKVYQQLGQLEPRDQIEAARQIIAKHDYIDGTKTAIWGWSYGGYATTRTIETDADSVFKCGFAVAPVTDWMFYHSIYTERYMRKPDENKDGYDRSTALQQSVNVGKHRYVVLHGTRDENVHFQNSARLEKYLVNEDIDFGAYFFADNDHGMSNTPNNYRSVYKTITREMQFCFGQPSLFGDCCN